MITPAFHSASDLAALRRAARAAEPELLPGLLEAARLSPAQAVQTQALALKVAAGVRERAQDSGRAGIVQGLLQEFALSSQEGVALMCLAEALLRIPDAATRDALIRDKISQGNWQQHLGQSPSLFVNAAAWGLLLTGRLVATHSDAGLSAALRRVVGRSGEPLVRKGVDMAMRMMGEQFVTGQTIEQALKRAREREAEGFRYSYDMLGEAALTAADAKRYLAAYEAAIHSIGQASAGRGIYEGPGISIKLSALHPRYSRAQIERVHAELYPVLESLALLARRYDIGLNIDAEESERLELSFGLLERLCEAPALAGWNGVGFVIQAYGKRCPALVDALIGLARRTQRRLMIRLVKGAYWDSEIKRAQLEGQSGYPVYTRKAYTDVAYIACARKLLAAPEAVFPQFATHNAHTLAAIHTLAGPNFYMGQYEFQCLHGMGEPLYEQVVGPVSAGKLGRPCRIYAPVGPHDTLLAYLVRRLLENGANSSFVNRVADADVPLAGLVEDPVATVERWAQAEGIVGAPHPAIALPEALFGHGARRNSAGLDLHDEAQLHRLGQALGRSDRTGPAAGGAARPGYAPIFNPARNAEVVGEVALSGLGELEQALARAEAAAPAWAKVPVWQRAQVLEHAADLLAAQTEALCALLVREAGKTWSNAVAEVREAIDFLRYDAQALRALDADTAQALRPLGVVACISPWNFPLAIFTGQVAAALAAGNAVLAKPAEQTPLIAQLAVAALHEAGVPRAALHLLVGDGPQLGAPLVADARVNGVLFTGSTEVARLIQLSTAQRLNPDGQPVALVAETGGQNTMLVDTSALLEQVVQDVLASAFDSAGQRCSALRLLCVQEEAADKLVEMLHGALRELRLGDPAELATDVGPVIDAAARAGLLQHIEAMRAAGRPVFQAHAAPAQGHFVAPTVIELDAVERLQREVFGPVLHVLRYRREELPALLERVNALGYGLTGGVHTRIDETVVEVARGLHVGNLYVNRNTVGAVVGVQPFGGQGLSGTGPKAGGPLYLLRLWAHKPAALASQAVAASGSPATGPVRGFEVGGATRGAWPPALRALHDWAQAQGDAPTASVAATLAEAAPRTGVWRTLPGPTGEANLHALLPREPVLCLASSTAQLLAQTAAVFALGGAVLWSSAQRSLFERLPAEARESVALVDNWQRLDARALPLQAVLHTGPQAEALALAQVLAQRPGPLVIWAPWPLPGHEAPAWEVLLHERSVSVNTAAAGGNASLMTLG
jgi:RHH-type proline utilization regulon transcriptional repressor/proline dehydrogenase/delta 1-pyrroline-5-carboxylate dehydrogenase